MKRNDSGENSSTGTRHLLG